MCYAVGMTNTATTPDTLIGGYFIRWNSNDNAWDFGRNAEVYGDAETLADAVATVREDMIDNDLCPDCADCGVEVNTIDGREFGYDRRICPVNECRWQLSDG